MTIKLRSRNNFWKVKQTAQVNYTISGPDNFHTLKVSCSHMRLMFICKCYIQKNTPQKKKHFHLQVFLMLRKSMKRDVCIERKTPMLQFFFPAFLKTFMKTKLIWKHITLYNHICIYVMCSNNSNKVEMLTTETTYVLCFRNFTALQWIIKNLNNLALEIFNYNTTWYLQFEAI